MGIQDRDYYRRRHGGPPSADATRPSTSGGSGANSGPVRRKRSGTGDRPPRRPPPGRSRRIRGKHFLLLVIALVIAFVVWRLYESGVLGDLGDEIVGWFTTEIVVLEPIELNFATDDGTAGDTGAASGRSGSGASGTGRGDDTAKDAGAASGGSGSGVSGTGQSAARSARAPVAPVAPPVGPAAECPDEGEILLAGSDALARPDSGIAAGEAADLRQIVLDLTNDARRAAGLTPVRLGANLAPQEHAEDMAESCFLSHWGTDGMKPYMRYSQAGGVQANAENVSGSSFCPADPSRYAQDSLAEEARQAVESLMGSLGHRANILRPEHRLLHLGLAYRAPNFWMVQQFSGHYAAFAQAPTIEGGELSFDMTACNGARVSRDDLSVQVRHDPLPSPLTPGQLQRTSCYSSGRAVAALRRPLGQRQLYTSHDFSLPGSGCLDPYLLDPDLPAAQSYDDAALLKVPARSGRSGGDELGVWITADRWDINGRRARVAADLSALLRAAGGGVYTILIWGSVRGDDVPIAEYSIFVE